MAMLFLTAGPSPSLNLKTKYNYSIGMNVMDLRYNTYFISCEKRFFRYTHFGVNFIFQPEYREDSTTYTGSAFGVYVRRYSDDNFFIHCELAGGTSEESTAGQETDSYYFMMPKVCLGFKFILKRIYFEPELALAPKLRLDSLAFSRKFAHFLLFLGFMF